MKDFTTIRGTKEFGAKEMILRQSVIDTISKVYQQNGFSLIKTPILESLEFLRRDSGDNQKLIFKTIKRGEKLQLDKSNLCEDDIIEEGLRFDLTVPLCRFFCNNKNQLPLPFKAIQIDDVFRAERPQRGRYRQFTQCDIDIFGEPNEIGEVELLCTAIDAYRAVGLPTEVEIRINNRQILQSVILSQGFEENEVGKINISLDKLDKIGVDGVSKELCEQGLESNKVTNLLQTILTIQKDGISALKKYSVNNELIASFESIITSIKSLRPNANIVFDITIVRGQSYYTSTVYEAYATGLGYRSAIGGGGRYDNMIEQFSGEKVSAVGFSIGLEGLMLLLQENNIVINKNKKLAILFDVKENIVDIIKAKEDLMTDYQVTIFPKQKNVKAQLDKIKNDGYYGFANFYDRKISDIKEF